MRSGDESGNHLVMDLVVVHFDMLCTFVKGEVADNEDGCLVTTMHVH